MSADTPESFAFDSLRPNEGTLVPPKARLRFGSLLGLGSGVPKTENDKEASWWQLARHNEFHEAKEAEPQKTRAFVIDIEGTYFFISVNSDALTRSTEEFDDKEFVSTEIDEDFAKKLTVDELPVEIQDNGSVLFTYYELDTIVMGNSDAKHEIMSSGGTWWDPAADGLKYEPTRTGLKKDPSVVGEQFLAYVREKLYQRQIGSG